MKLAVLTPYFPWPAASRRGHSACPQWLAPNAYKDPPGPTDRPPEFKTATYFQYPAAPLLNWPIHGFTCAHLLPGYGRAASADIILNYWLYSEGYSAVRAGRPLGIPVIAGAFGAVPAVCRRALRA